MIYLCSSDYCHVSFFYYYSQFWRFPLPIPNFARAFSTNTRSANTQYTSTTQRRCIRQALAFCEDCVSSQTWAQGTDRNTGFVRQLCRTKGSNLKIHIPPSPPPHPPLGERQFNVRVMCVTGYPFCLSDYETLGGTKIS